MSKQASIAGEMVLQISGILTEHHERALPRPIPLHPSIKPDPFLAVKDVPIWPEMSRTPLDQQAVSVPQDEARKEMYVGWFPYILG